MRSTIFAVGLCATAVISLQALALLPFGLQTPRNSWQVIAVAVAASAFVGPLVGTIVGARQERWKPLVTGCVLGVFVLIVLVGFLLLPEVL